MIKPTPEELIGNKKKLVLALLFEKSSEIDALEVSRTLGVRYQSAWRCLRALCKEDCAKKTHKLERVGGFSHKKIVKWEITNSGKRRAIYFQSLKIKTEDIAHD